MGFTDTISDSVHGGRIVLDFLVGAVVSGAAVGGTIAGSTILGGLAGAPGAFVGVAAGLSAAGAVNEQIERTLAAGYQALGLTPHEGARRAGHRFGAILGSLGGSTLGMRQVSSR